MCIYIQQKPIELCMVVWLDCRKVFFTFSELLFYRDNASILALPCGVFIRSAFAGTHTVRLELSKFFEFLVGVLIWIRFILLFRFIFFQLSLLSHLLRVLGFRIHKFLVVYEADSVLQFYLGALNNFIFLNDTHSRLYHHIV